MSDEMSWTDKARRMAEFHSEALEFIERAGQHLPVSHADAPAVSRLWLEAEELDDFICGLLEEMNAELLDGSASVDTTRGASPRIGAMDQHYAAYDCAWSLLWDEGRSVSMILSIDSQTMTCEARVTGTKSGRARGMGFPVSERELKDALTDAYVAEAFAELE